VLTLSRPNGEVEAALACGLERIVYKFASVIKNNPPSKSLQYIE